MEMVTKSAQETQRLGEKIANQLKGGEVLALSGELGGGKTTFLQGLAKGLGIKERILSPTFIMMRQYSVTDHRSRITDFYHVDLYRVESEKDIEGLGLEEIWGDPENIVTIEWAEKIKNILPKKRMEIFFEYLEENERRITVNSKL
jgi:tRNA threonylcarbamoyladenosine biosynthesis protein TsaE